MKSTRLLTAALAAMMAGLSAASAQVIAAAHAPSVPKTAEPSRTTGSSRNGGYRTGNRAYQRLALKKRNRARHRAANR